MRYQLALIALIVIAATPYKGHAKSLDNDELVVAPRALPAYDWKNYQSLDTTIAWLRQLAKQYPKQVSLFVAGKSYQGREILGVKISYGKAVAGKRRSIFIEGGMHAREWISPATTTYIINQLLTSKDALVRRIAESHVWYVVPHINPDGYVYSQTKDRLWRKTVNPYKPCQGADINRNFDFHWFEKDASNDTCTEIYAGPKPFSEIETRSLANYVTSIKNELVLYLSMHSYGQKLFFPYGYTNQKVATYNNLKRVTDVGVAAISKRHGTKYQGGAQTEIEYEDSGSSTDWAFGVAKIPYVFCYELRPMPDGGFDGFKLAANQIIPTSEETLDSIVAMVNEIDVLEK